MRTRNIEVRWTESSILDLEAIGHYITLESPETARRILHRLRSRASALSKMPMRGRKIPELAGSGLAGFREILSRPWRIMYRVSGEVVFIYAVFDGRRDLRDVLFERLTRA